MREFGLIGKKLSHSFSKKYFEEKFKSEQITGSSYSLFELDSIDELDQLLAEHPELNGLNVTIPYKQSVIPFLNEIDSFAKEIGAVNTIKISEGELAGYNTDYFGFITSLKEWLGSNSIKNALILGTGGASKAVGVALSNLNIESTIVSRQGSTDYTTYNDLDQEIISHNKLIINTTPLGMYPKTETFPDIPYQYLTKDHYLYDLVYNPETTTFMRKGLEHKASVKNGLEMLILQAEKAWDIWNS